MSKMKKLKMKISSNQFLKFCVGKQRVVNTLVMSALLTTIVACSEKGIDKSHQSGAPTLFEDSVPTFLYDPASQEKLNQLSLTLPKMESTNDALEAKINSASLFNVDFSVAANRSKIQARDEIVRTAYAEVYEPLAAVVLNPNYINDELVATSSVFKRQFRELNKAVYNIVRLDPEFAKSSGMLSRYWDSFTRECGVDLRACTTAKVLLRSDGSRTTMILESYAWALHESIESLRNSADSLSRERHFANALLARHDELVLKKKSVMHLALGTRGGSRQEDSTIGLLYLISTPELDALPLDSWNEEEREQQITNAQRIVLGIGSLIENEEYREKVKPFFDKKKIWSRFTLRDPIAQRKSDGSLPTAIEVMKLSCKFFRDEAAGYDDAVKASLLQSDAWGKKGFIAEVNEMRQSVRSGIVLADMRLTEPLVVSEELFFLDQLYRGHWDRDIMQECWNSYMSELPKEVREQKKIAMMALIERYVRLQFLRQVISTNQFIKDLFDRENGTTVKKEDLFLQVIDESRLLKSDWDSMTKAFDKIRLFAKANMEDPAADSQSKEYEQLEQIFSTVKTNIKLVSVYPNMLLLSYFLAARKFDIEITVWGRKVKLSYATIISWLFGGQTGDPLAPFFNFGNDSRPIKRFENLYAFFYALKTGSFDNFTKDEAESDPDATKDPLLADADLEESTSDDAIKPLSIVNFFSEVVSSYIAPDTLKITEEIKNIEKHFGNAGLYEDALATCEAELEVHEYDQYGRNLRRVSPATKHYRLDHSIDSFINYTFMDFGRNGPAKKLADVYLGSSFNANIAGVMEKVHDDFYPKYLFVQTMIEILEDHWMNQQELAKDANFPIGAKERLQSALQMEAKLDKIRSNFDTVYDGVRRTYQMAKIRNAEVHDCVDLAYAVEFEQQKALYQNEADFLGAVYRALGVMNQLSSDQAILSTVSLKRIRAIFNNAVNGRYSEEDQAVLDLPELHALSEIAAVYLESRFDTEGFDELDENGAFIYSRYNYVLRARNRMRVLNPNVKISLPAKMEDDPIFKEARHDNYRVKILVGDEGSEESFIRNAMTAAENKNFVKWYPNRNFQLLDARKDFKQAMYRLEHLGIIQNAKNNCNRASVQSKNLPSCESWEEFEPVKMHEIIDEVFRIADLVNIEPDDEQLMRRLGHRQKVDGTLLSKYFLDQFNEPQTLFEYQYGTFTDGSSSTTTLYRQAKMAAQTYNSMFRAEQEEEGSEESARSDSELTIVDWSKQEARELLFLAKHDTVRSNTRKIYRPAVLAYESSVAEFEAVIRCLEERDRNLPASDLSVLYQIDVDDRENVEYRYIQPKAADRDSLVYLDRRELTNFKAIKSTFAQETKGVYLARRGDSDFGMNDSAQKKDCAVILGQKRQDEGRE